MPEELGAHNVPVLRTPPLTREWAKLPSGSRSGFRDDGFRFPLRTIHRFISVTVLKGMSLIAIRLGFRGTALTLKRLLLPRHFLPSGLAGIDRVRSWAGGGHTPQAARRGC